MMEDILKNHVMRDGYKPINVTFVVPEDFNPEDIGRTSFDIKARMGIDQFLEGMPRDITIAGLLERMEDPASEEAVRLRRLFLAVADFLQSAYSPSQASVLYLLLDYLVTGEMEAQARDSLKRRAPDPESMPLPPETVIMPARRI